MSKINLLLSSHDNVEGKKILNINYSCCDFFLKKNLRNKFLQNRWNNIQKKESDVKKILKISSEISLLLKKKLDKDNLPNNHWKFRKTIISHIDNCRSYGLMVMTADFESASLGSIPSRT